MKDCSLKSYAELRFQESYTKNYGEVYKKSEENSRINLHKIQKIFKIVVSKDFKHPVQDCDAMGGPLVTK